MQRRVAVAHAIALATGLVATVAASGCCREADPWNPPSEWATQAAVAAYLCTNAKAAASLCGVEAQGVASVETMLLVPEKGESNPGKVWVRGTAVLSVNGRATIRPAVPKHCSGIMTFSTKLVDSPDGSKTLVVASMEVTRAKSPDEGWIVIEVPKTSGGHGHHDLF